MTQARLRQWQAPSIGSRRIATSPSPSDAYRVSHHGPVRHHTIAVAAALGALLITLISNAMNMARISYYLTLVLKGLVIIIFVWLNSRREQ